LGIFIIWKTFGVTRTSSLYRCVSRFAFCHIVLRHWTSELYPHHHRNNSASNFSSIVRHLLFTRWRVGDEIFGSNDYFQRGKKSSDLINCKVQLPYVPAGNATSNFSLLLYRLYANVVVMSMPIPLLNNGHVSSESITILFLSIGCQYCKITITATIKVSES